MSEVVVGASGAGVEGVEPRRASRKYSMIGILFSFVRFVQVRFVTISLMTLDVRSQRPAGGGCDLYGPNRRQPLLDQEEFVAGRTGLVHIAEDDWHYLGRQRESRQAERRIRVCACDVD